MKAIRVQMSGPPEVMKLMDIADPQPAAGQVLVRAKAIGINPVDTYIRAGNYGPFQGEYTPGMDAAGIIERTGSGVTRVREGQRVYVARSVSGTYAELILANEDQVHPLPDNVSFAQGAAVNVPYATAYRALFHKAQAKRGETVLVHGATGGVGTAAVQLGKAAGLVVVGTGGTGEGRELARKNGAQHVLDHHQPNYLTDSVAAITAGRGYDVILEMLANVNLDQDLDAVARNGRIVVIGNRGRVEIDPRKAMARDSTILGMTLMNASADELSSIHAALVDGLANGSLSPVIGKEMPLAEAAAAHHEVLKPGAYGKIVLIP